MDSGYEAECRKHLKEAIERKKLAEQRDDAEGIRLAQRDIAHFRRALSEGVGKGGRRRKMGDPAEKARSSITQAIGLLRKKLKIQHPKFHEHLAGSLFTGTHCTYSPSSSIDWRF
jgi:hypothetical protein